MSFWKTQPVESLSSSDVINENCCQSVGIINDNVLKDVSQVPLILPDTSMYWEDIDSKDEFILTAFQDFLSENYVTDKEDAFRLSYSLPFLKSMISQAISGCQILIKHNSSKNIIGSIIAIPKRIKVKDQMLDTCEINLLCVKKDYRDKQLAPLLIQEIARRLNLRQINTAIFTCGSKLPLKSFASAQYFHKLLDVEKLNKVGITNFSNDDLPSAILQYNHRILSYRKSQHQTDEDGFMHIFRLANIKDVSDIVQLFKTSENNYELQEEINYDKLVSMINDVNMHCFIIEKVYLESKSRKVDGFVSFYTVLTKSLKKSLDFETEYMYYYCGTIIPCIDGIFSYFQKQGKSMITCLNIGENSELIKEKKLLPGNAMLNYYMYNYRLPAIQLDSLFYLVC